MSTVASPYGLIPVEQGDNSKYTAIKIASGYAANIFTGDVVNVVAAGTLQVNATVGTAASPFVAGTVGVFMGCQYTDPVRGLVHSQYWPSGTVASDAVGFVVTDPNTVFRVQGNFAGSVPITQAELHQNCALALTAGSTVTGKSKFCLDTATLAVTATVAFKIIGFVNAPGSTIGDAYTDVLVKFNPTSHAYTAGTGI